MTLPVGAAQGDGRDQLGPLDDRRVDHRVGDSLEVLEDLARGRPPPPIRGHRPADEVQSLLVEEAGQPSRIPGRSGAFPRLQVTDDGQSELVHVRLVVLQQETVRTLAFRRYPECGVRLLTIWILEAGRVVAVQQHDSRRLHGERRVQVAEIADHPVLFVQYREREGQLRHQQQSVGQGDLGHVVIDAHPLPVRVRHG